MRVRFGLVGVIAASMIGAPAAAETPLMAGAAKVEVAPPATRLREGFTGILDPLYARALVLDHDGRQIVFITLDAGAIPTELWTSITAQLREHYGIAPDSVMVTATHTHSVPRSVDPNVVPGVVRAVSEAIAHRQAARIAYGEGRSYINVNRDLIDPKTRRWWEGPNPDGPSDKTVAVLRIETLQGAPIAIYYNYAVHAVLTGQLDLISADLPGAASRYIEQSIGNDVVALWSEGAAGDQNPLYLSQSFDLRDIRIRDYARRGQDISNAMPPGGQGLDRTDPQVRRLMDQQRQMTQSMGQMLGEEVLQTMRVALERPESAPVLRAVQETVSCPGRARTDSGRAGNAGTYVDAPPVQIRLSLVRIGHIVIGGVDAEVFNAIATRFKAESPYRRTMMATLTNGFADSGYIPSDAAFGQATFEVISSRLKPGCAERAIVDGLLDLTQQTE